MGADEEVELNDDTEEEGLEQNSGKGLYVRSPRPQELEFSVSTSASANAPAETKLTQAGFEAENIDLNKVSAEELRVAKERMNKQFEANRRRPDDLDFIYDVEVDF